jgi:spore germination cell wall hydrolase CwlJ-like protein
MFYSGRRVVPVLIVCCLAILIGAAAKHSFSNVMTREVVCVPAEGVPNTKGTHIQEALGAHEEQEGGKRASEKKESDHEKILAEADKAITDAERLLMQYDRLQLQDPEKISEKALRENIILANRGVGIEYKPEVKASQYNLSNEEFNLLSQVVEAEAGGEPYEGQIAVANVIFNRVKSGWAGTVKEVITQDGQFTPKRKAPSDSVINAIKEAQSGRNAVPEGTLFFQNLNTSTDFTIPHTKEYVTKIGLHTFYR